MASELPLGFVRSRNFSWKGAEDIAIVVFPHRIVGISGEDFPYSETEDRKEIPPEVLGKSIFDIALEEIEWVDAIPTSETRNGTVVIHPKSGKTFSIRIARDGGLEFDNLMHLLSKFFGQSPKRASKDHERTMNKLFIIKHESSVESKKRRAKQRSSMRSTSSKERTKIPRKYVAALVLVLIVMVAGSLFVSLYGLYLYTDKQQSSDASLDFALINSNSTSQAFSANYHTTMIYHTDTSIYGQTTDLAVGNGCLTLTFHIPQSIPLVGNRNVSLPIPYKPIGKVTYIYDSVVHVTLVGVIKASDNGKQMTWSTPNRNLAVEGSLNDMRYNLTFFVDVPVPNVNGTITTYYVIHPMSVELAGTPVSIQTPFVNSSSIGVDRTTLMDTVIPLSIPLLILFVPQRKMLPGKKVLDRSLSSQTLIGLRDTGVVLMISSFVSIAALSPVLLGKFENFSTVMTSTSPLSGGPYAGTLGPYTEPGLILILMASLLAMLAVLRPALLKGRLTNASGKSLILPIIGASLISMGIFTSIFLSGFFATKAGPFILTFNPLMNHAEAFFVVGIILLFLIAIGMYEQTRIPIAFASTAFFGIFAAMVISNYHLLPYQFPYDFTHVFQFGILMVEFGIFLLFLGIFGILWGTIIIGGITRSIPIFLGIAYFILDAIVAYLTLRDIYTGLLIPASNYYLLISGILGGFSLWLGARRALNIYKTAPDASSSKPGTSSIG